MKILITGGTGLLGTDLIDKLVEAGHHLVISTRQLRDPWIGYPAEFVKWPLVDHEMVNHYEDLDACIHLVGESIAGGRWTKNRKAEIRDSRVIGTRQLVEHLNRCNNLKVFLSSSAIGIYGDRGSEPLSENAPPAREGFLPRVCREWEAEAQKLNNPTTRISLIRTGIVLKRGGGILGQVEPLFKNRLGGPLGSGTQGMSWIHHQDWIRAMIYALERPEIKGPLNLTAPNPVSNRQFTEAFGRLFGQSFFPPVPKMALKLAMGEMSSIALDSCYARPEKLLHWGFKFEHPDIDDALEDIYEFTDYYRKVDEYFGSRQYVDLPLEHTFKFFSDESNLEKITPPELQFRILTKSTSNLEEGTLINYELKIHGVPVHWQTRIDKWEPPHRFIDTQLKGPYKRWHHTHSFCPLREGTLMKDSVHFRLPMGALGRLAGLPFVKSDVQKIFDYRRKKIEELIG